MNTLSLGSHWAGLNARVKRWIVVGGIALGLMSMVYLFQPAEKVRSARNDRSGLLENVLTDKNSRQVTLDSMAARIQDLEEAGSKKQQELDRLKEELKKKERAPANDPDRAALEMQVQDLQKRVGDLQQRAANPPEPAVQQKEPPPSDRARPLGRVPGDLPQRPPVMPAAASTRPPTAADFYPAQQASAPSQGQQGQQGDRADTAVAAAAPRAPADIRVLVEEEVGTDPLEQEEETAQNYLPAGSIFSGTAITGMDAPTGNSARKEPFPALFRVKHDAILPNRWKADVRECFLLVAGFGDLSSERAYLRGETISCVTKDGKVLEAQFPAYAVGEDGKAGIRGRLVSKQGQVIGRALMAGFLDGVSKAFDVKPVPVLATSNTGKTQYADVFAGEQSLRSAAFGGASSALEKIADFYIDMAANIFPVIEVDSGRKIDFVATRGFNLTFRKKGREQAAQDMRQLGQGGQREQQGGLNGALGGALGSMFGFGGQGGLGGGSNRR